MRGARATIASLLALAAAAAIPGCGGSSGPSSPTTTPPPETAQKLPKLPPRWKSHRDSSIGFAIGIPPGWKLDSHGGRVLIRSPDRLVAVSLAVDRNGDALALPLKEFATRALAALPGFRSTLEPRNPKPFRDTPLSAVWTEAGGTTKSGHVPELATIVVLRRDHVVTYTVAVLANRRQPSTKLDLAYALRMVRTLRDQPVQTQAAPGSL